MNICEFHAYCANAWNVVPSKVCTRLNKYIHFRVPECVCVCVCA